MNVFVLGFSVRPAARAALSLAAALSIGSLAACHRPVPTAPEATAAEVIQTSFPGQVTAGGRTSGEVMAAAGEFTQQGDDQGTPGIPKGSGGNTGGAELGGAQDGQSSIGGDGQQSAVRP